MSEGGRENLKRKAFRFHLLLFFFSCFSPFREDLYSGSKGIFRFISLLFFLFLGSHSSCFQSFTIHSVFILVRSSKLTHAHTHTCLHTCSCWHSIHQVLDVVTHFYFRRWDAWHRVQFLFKLPCVGKLHQDLYLFCFVVPFSFSFFITLYFLFVAGTYYFFVLSLTLFVFTCMSHVARLLLLRIVVRSNQLNHDLWTLDDAGGCGLVMDVTIYRESFAYNFSFWIWSTVLFVCLFSHCNLHVRVSCFTV